MRIMATCFWYLDTNLAQKILGYEIQFAIIVSEPKWGSLGQWSGSYPGPAHTMGVCLVPAQGEIPKPRATHQIQP
jgi:hypothetical protein